MPVSDFTVRRRTVLIDDRRFSIGPPTVGAVLTFLAYFGDMFPHFEDAYSKVEGPVDMRDIAKAFVMLRPDRAEDVLRLCVDGDDSAWPAVDLAVEVLSRCDTRRIWDSFISHGTEPATIYGPESAMIVLAERFHCTPFDVMDWPYEALLTIADVTKNQATGTEMADDSWISEANRS